MAEYQRKPEWLKIKLSDSLNFRDLKALRTRAGLHTVCEEARCPNIHECWGQRRTATFMVLGDTCTRRCRFCSVKTGHPGVEDYEEPRRAGESVAALGLSHVVITMVTRDDLADGGAEIIARTVLAIRKYAPRTSVEVLTSDFMGRKESLKQVLEAKPEIFSHNLETVRRLTPHIRSRSSYERSLGILEQAVQWGQNLVKSSIMLGLGEEIKEVETLMDDLLTRGVKILNMGQYLQPSEEQLPVHRYLTPGEFTALRETALAKGFSYVESGPLVRSSYHAGEQYEELSPPRAEK